MKERIANNQDHLRQEEAIIERRNMLRHPNIMLLKDWSLKKDSKVCAEFYALRAYYLYNIENLELQCKKRQKDGMPFDDI